jgi:ABC-type cobalamin/Fe3+-siderophores transport system ATPase subunit
VSLLRASGLAVRLGTREVLAGVELEVPAGSVLLVAGRNGAGKSTLLRALCGVLTPGAGTVEFGGRPIGAMAPKERARAIAFVPQESDSAFEFTGRELIAMGRHPHLRVMAGLGERVGAEVERAMRLMDAADFADRPVTTLSGGELRRIAVARGLATAAPVLLLDEPTSNLDLEHALRLVRLLRELARQGSTVVVASHDLNLLGPCADRLALLHAGRIAACGPPADVLADAGVVEQVFGVCAADPVGFFPRDFRPSGAELYRPEGNASGAMRNDSNC